MKKITKVVRVDITNFKTFETGVPNAGFSFFLKSQNRHHQRRFHHFVKIKNRRYQRRLLHFYETGTPNAGFWMFLNRVGLPFFSLPRISSSCVSSIFSLRLSSPAAGASIFHHSPPRRRQGSIETTIEQPLLTRFVLCHVPAFLGVRVSLTVPCSSDYIPLFLFADSINVHCGFYLFWFILFADSGCFMCPHLPSGKF